jgi:amino acid transporter
MVGGMVLVTAVNIVGVRQASWTVNAFTVAKLLPLVLLIGVGLMAISDDVLATQAVAAPDWTEAVLLLVFAYGGFESGILAAGETRDPKRDSAFALIAGMLAVTAIYSLVQLVVVGVLPHAAQDTAPVASAIGVLLGDAGRTIGGVAVVISVYGWLTGFALVTPRLVFAMADRRELPRWLARVHPRFRTPDRAILANSAIALALGLGSNFTQVATLAAITRLLIFGLTCAALIAFRRQSARSAGFTLPGGPAIAVAGIVFSGWLLSTRNLAQGWGLLALMAAGFVVRALVRRIDGGPASDRAPSPDAAR